MSTQPVIARQATAPSLPSWHFHEARNPVQRLGGGRAPVPMVRFLLSSVARGRANAYLAWVSLGPVTSFLKARRGWRLFAIPT